MSSRTPPSYVNAVIYKMVNDVDDKIYIGSTTMPLNKRKTCHKDCAKKHPNRRVYKHLNEIGWESVKCILIEKYPCADKYELESRERYWIELLKPELNKVIPTREPICEHNRRRSQCKECGGGSICEHNKHKAVCKECGGSQICEHNRERSKCKECGGGSICEHNRMRSQCKECGGCAICEHNRERAKCKDCGGSQICEHNRMRFTCKECGGSGICEHNRMRNQCKECNPSAYEKTICPCGGRYIHMKKSQHYKTAKHMKWEAEHTDQHTEQKESE